MDNLLLFPAVKDFQNWSTVDEVIAKISTTRSFLRHSVYMCVFSFSDFKQDSSCFGKSNAVTADQTITVF